MYELGCWRFCPRHIDFFFFFGVTQLSELELPDTGWRGNPTKERCGESLPRIPTIHNRVDADDKCCHWLFRGIWRTQYSSYLVRLGEAVT